LISLLISLFFALSFPFQQVPRLSGRLLTPIKPNAMATAATTTPSTPTIVTIAPLGIVAASTGQQFTLSDGAIDMEAKSHAHVEADRSISDDLTNNKNKTVGGSQFENSISLEDVRQRLAQFALDRREKYN
jgi:hypothetical protein